MNGGLNSCTDLKSRRKLQAKFTSDLEASKASYAQKVADEKASLERDYRDELARLQKELASSQANSCKS